ncbi:DEKNAAC104819 [Brettanomyces naardenensis]|uniref:DEKNAAC104819 n=1 Tax=Brettanomyces naardenensis TaxID=13370 RepID=A0A448YSH5_BRENA|nr:DEKNAAC104819 [Brettanomyces naardenensis]
MNTEKKLNKKPSLSILSGSSINKLNNAETAYPQKPMKERIISESTGLIKFSLRKPSGSGLELEKAQLLEKENLQRNSEKQGLPIYIPVERNHEQSEVPRISYIEEEEEQEEAEKEVINHSSARLTEHEMNEANQGLLFKLASKQRRVLDLKEELAEMERELESLEVQYKDNVLPQSPSRRKEKNVEERREPEVTKTLGKKPSILEFASTIGKKGSIMNFGEREGQNITRSLNMITESISHNITSNPFLNKGKTMLTNFSKENENWIDERAQILRQKLQEAQIKDPRTLFGNVYNRLNPTRKKDNAINNFINSVFDPREKDEGSDNEANGSFSYSDSLCNEIDRKGLGFQSKTKNTPVHRERVVPKLPRRPLSFPSDSEDDEQDSEDDYGGNTVPYN